jgi:hypothetical protein
LRSRYSGIVPEAVQKARARSQAKKATQGLLSAMTSLVRPKVKSIRKRTLTRLVPNSEKGLAEKRAEATKRMLADKNMGRILYNNEPDYVPIPRRSKRNAS